MGFEPTTSCLGSRLAKTERFALPYHLLLIAQRMIILLHAMTIVNGNTITCVNSLHGGATLKGRDIS